MEIIKIYFAAQPDNLKTDISELETFIFRINNCYVSRGHYFTPILSESTSDDATRESEVADCALAFFLTVPGSNLPDAYKTAITSYNKIGRPKLFVYTKSEGVGNKGLGSRDEGLEDVGRGSGNGQLISGECREESGARSANFSNSQFSMRREQAPALHTTFYVSRPYAHIDTLKLEILMQIKQLGLDGVDIRLEDGKAWQGTTVLLSLENVEAVSGYENLQNLKQKRAELESRYYAAKTRHSENPDDNEAYEAFFEASKQRGEAVQEIRDIEAQLYHMMEGMYEQTSHGKLTTRQAEGYRLIERGLLNEARDVLDFDAIISESRHHEELAEQAAKHAQDTVNELMQLKDVNATLLDWDAVDACYREAVRLEEKYDLPRRAAISLNPIETDYMSFLICQYRHDEAVQLGERLRKYYEDAENCSQTENMSYVLNLLGIIYYETQHMAESEEALKAALAIRSARTDGDANAIAKDIAIVYNNLGNMYCTAERFEEAIQAHRSALEIRKRLVERNSDAFIEYLAYTYVNLGNVYNEIKKYNESVELMVSAKDIFKELSARKPVPHLEFLADCYCNMGVSYTSLECFTEAEEQLGLALEIQKKQAENDPGIYEPRVAKTYSDFGRLYDSAKRYADAEESYSIALKMFIRLAKRTPDAFETELAKCYYSMSELFIEKERYSEAEDVLLNAINLYEKYAGTNPACAEKVTDARSLLENLRDAKHRSEAAYSGLSQKEKSIAGFLADGLTKREIIRKLNIDANEYERHELAIREKLGIVRDTDPVIEATVAEYKLTKRETEILRCLRNDRTNREIAAELFLSEETVKKHIRNMMKKIPMDKRSGIFGL